MKNPTLHCLQQANAILGESPLWHPTQAALYWADILRPAIYRLVPGVGQTGQWPMPSAVGAIGFCNNNELLVALEHEGICRFNPQTGALRVICDPVKLCGPKDVSGRYNDGRVDLMGNFWVGWLSHSRTQPGALFRIVPSGMVHKALDNLTAPNGLGWSGDGKTLYITDSHINTIWAYACDLETVQLGDRRMLVTQDRKLGIFDGLCVDSDGNIWTALYGGGAVLQLSPEGQVRSRIELPVDLATSCSFGGEGLHSLLITTAVRRQSAAELLAQPRAGSVFSVETSSTGLPEAMAGFQHSADTGASNHTP